MKLKNVKYASLANLGNYQNERIELEAHLEDGDDYKEVLAKLTQMVHQNGREASPFYGGEG